MGLSETVDNALNKMVTDESDRAAVVIRIADKIGVDASTLNEIAQGSILCPPRDRIKSLASALGISEDTLIAAARKDGCEYPDPDEGESMKTDAKHFAHDDKDKGKDDKDEKMGKDEEKGEDMMDSPIDVKAVCDAIDKKEISIGDMDMILAAIQGVGAGDSEEETEEEQPAPAAAPGAEAMKAQPMSAQFAALQGQNIALEARLDARDESDAVKSDVDGAMEKLRDRPLGSGLREKLMAFRIKPGAAEFFPGFVQALEASHGPLPEDGTAANFSATASKTPDEAMAYMTDGGTGAVDKAAKFCADYDELKAHNLTGKRTREQHVAINMARTASGV